MSDVTCAVFNEFRQEGKLCDVVIKVADVEFNAHKIIMCSCSEYFCTLFTGSWATSKTMYTIPGVSPEVMHLIINYAYTRSVSVTEDNVVEVLAAAIQLMVPGIVQACVCFLVGQLCPRNCINFWRLAEFYQCSELQHKVFFYILYHFEEIVSVSPELLELSVQQLAAIIENNHLNVSKEKTVFEVILHWINHLPDQRRQHISELLPKVRLGLLNPAYLLHTVRENEVVKSSSECTPIIREATKARLTLKGNRRAACTSSLACPRLPADILLVTGGQCFSNPATNFEAYDALTDRWVTMSAGVCRAHHGTAVLGSSLYIIGGCNHKAYLDTVQRFDFVTGTWHRMAPMNACRCYVSVAVLNGCIYAMGGFTGDIYTNTVECYKPEIDKWIMMAPMYAIRCGASASTLNGKVYICGGFNGRDSISQAECYNPDSNLWTIITPMTRRRSGHGTVTYRNHIYAVGGTILGNTCMRSVEAYHPQTDTWTPRPPMYTPRCYFGIEVVNDHLYVVGGHKPSTTVVAVECYDANTRKWKKGSHAEMPHSGLSCCVLRGLPSVAEKLFPRP